MHQRTARRIWIVLSILLVLGMLVFTVAPLAYR
jgi:hypothetical protein